MCIIYFEVYRLLRCVSCFKVYHESFAKGSLETDGG